MAHMPRLHPDRRRDPIPVLGRHQLREPDEPGREPVMTARLTVLTSERPAVLSKTVGRRSDGTLIREGGAPRRTSMPAAGTKSATTRAIAADQGKRGGRTRPPRSTGPKQQFPDKQHMLPITWDLSKSDFPVPDLQFTFNAWDGLAPKRRCFLPGCKQGWRRHVALHRGSHRSPSSLRRSRRRPCVSPR